jgi:hypothetical protein
MGSISQLVSVLPGVLAVGGSNLVMNGLILTNNPRMPSGVVLSFPTAVAVVSYFGSAATEAVNAPFYFNGYDNSSAKPGAILFAQFPYSTALGAFLRGGSFGNTTFANSGITGITAGGFSIVIDGGTFTVSSLNLASATSYSSAAGTIQTALQAAQPTVASVTGAISTTTLTVSAVSSGTLAPGEVLSGSGVTANTLIVSQLTGTTGGVGTYQVSISQTAASTTITAKPQLPTVTFDSIASAFLISSGSTGANSTIAFPTGGSGNVFPVLQISAAQGAIISQGGAAITGLPAITAAMNAIVAINSDWTGLGSVFEPTTNDKVAIAAWINNTPGDDYWYAMWDSSQVPLSGTDTTSAGYQIFTTYGYNGTLPLCYDSSYATLAQLQATAWAALGTAASINWNVQNGRKRLAGSTQAGLATTVSNSTYQANALAVGYSFYGQYSGQGNNYNQFQAGAISGAFDWWDSYINQIWLNNACQVSLAACLMQNGNLPYNQPGYDTVKGYLYNGVPTAGNGVSVSTGPVAAALNFGAINPGITLSASQISALQSQGVNVTTLVNTGFYIRVADPGPTVRSQRGSPITALWYCDGGQIQRINLTSTDVQ